MLFLFCLLLKLSVKKTTTTTTKTAQHIAFEEQHARNDCDVENKQTLIANINMNKTKRNKN